MTLEKSLQMSMFLLPEPKNRRNTIDIKSRYSIELDEIRNYLSEMQTDNA